MNSLLMLPLADAPVTQWDSPAIIIGKLAVIAALVALNGFFVACEFAIIKVRASQLDELAGGGLRLKKWGGASSTNWRRRGTRGRVSQNIFVRTSTLTFRRRSSA